MSGQGQGHCKVYWALSGQDQGHCKVLNVFYNYHSTNSPINKLLSKLGG